MSRLTAPPPDPAAAEAAAAVAAALDRLSRLHPKIIDLSLDRVLRLLAALGDPHLRLPPAIHVAGTNGKGSTVAFLRAMLEAAGWRVHAYISPHLVRFNERIRLAGALIGDAALAEVLARCEAANDGQPITYFEITTAAAFLAFAEVPADAVLLETGLGGRLDATNVLDRPAVTVITRISIDHTHYLGDGIAAIAGEKAGILKPGMPCVVGPQPAPEALATLRARAAAVGAPLVEHGRDWEVVAEPDGFVLHGAAGGRRWPLPALPGTHQVVNAATAMVALDRLTALPVPAAAMAAGLAAVEWPARLQRLTRGPLAAALPPGWELWLDGGHNDSAGEVLAAWAAGLDRRPLHLVVGMLETKDAGAFLRPLAPFAASLRTVAIPGAAASLSAAALAATARSAGFEDAAPAGSVAEAVAGQAARPGPAQVLICGSLYLAGAVLAENG